MPKLIKLDLSIFSLYKPYLIAFMTDILVYESGNIGFNRRTKPKQIYQDITKKEHIQISNSSLLNLVEGICSFIMALNDQLHPILNDLQYIVLAKTFGVSPYTIRHILEIVQMFVYQLLDARLCTCDLTVQEIICQVKL